ncbi:MAG: hypothetical protein KAS32_30295 [Candidatus Peribacteraceae bacterium]|nr:hypothetical protein [Candidatus Peribacteraceae bacterium]
MPMTEEEVKATFEKISVHCPELDENMRPAFVLLNETCKYGHGGKCHACSLFIGASSEDDTYYSSGAYEGFCGGEYKTSEAIDDIMSGGVSA